MRLIAFIVASIAASAPAAAQGWTEYAYPSDAFTVAFPADPKIETTTYQTADGRLVEARIYSVDPGRRHIQDDGRRLPRRHAGGKRRARPCGQDAVRREARSSSTFPTASARFTAASSASPGPEGSRSMVAVFYCNRRLYLIEGKALPGWADATADAIRFQQSLVFTDEGTNRSN